MTKVVVIGDCHFKTANAVQTEKMCEAILEQCGAKQPDFIVMLGDTLDRHENIHVDPLSRATTFLYHLTQIAPTYLLIGNHDRPNNSDFLSEKHPFVGLKYMPNLTIVDKVIRVRDFVFVPYVPPGRFKEALATVEYDYCNTSCIFAHQEFRGAKMGAIVSTEGDEWESHLPLVVSGHVHDYDELQNNILYTGTPIQHSFGDKEDKTISYFTFTHPGYEHVRINLQLPKKQLLYYTFAEFMSINPDSIDATNEVKIIVKGTGVEIKSIFKSKLVKMLEGKNIKISYKEVSEGQVESVNIEPAGGYHEKLIMAVQENKALTEIVHRLFGPLKLKL